MDPIAEFYREGQRFSVPKLFLAVILFFVGLSFVAEFYVELPKLVATAAPQGVHPGLLRTVVHLFTSIFLAALGYFGKVVVDFWRIGKKYPRHYIYCHQSPDNTNDLVFGHFSIHWSRDINFCARGASYDWDSSALTDRNHWVSMAIAPNTATPSLNEMFLIVSVQPHGPTPQETWIASYRRIEKKGIVIRDSAYQAIVQKLSGETDQPLLGYAELIAKRKWGLASEENDDSLKAKTEQLATGLKNRFVQLNPRNGAHHSFPSTSKHASKKSDKPEEST